METVKEAQDTTEESIFMENMNALTRFSYDPCCIGNDDIWRELQKTVSRLLVSNKGWLLGTLTSDLVSGEGQLVKDVLAAVTNLLVIADQHLIDKDKIIADTNERLIDKDNAIFEARVAREALKAEFAQFKLAQEKGKKKKKRQALTI